MTTFTIAQSLTDGKAASFIDTSDINFSSIKKTRFLFYVYSPVEPQVLVNPEIMEQYREYKSLTLTGYTYDNKSIPIGGTIIPQITGIVVLAGSEMESERYSSPTSFLPTANYTPRVLYPADMGILDEVVFPDMIGSLTYEQYIDNSPLTPTNLVEGKQYIVTGAGSTATYGGNIYRENEAFIAGDNGVISFTGGGTVKVLSDLRFQYFAFTYNLQKKLASIQAIIFRNCMETEQLVYDISNIYANLNGITFSSIQDYTSASLMYDTLQDLTQQVDLILGKLENPC
jgi:hypothetical protein